MTCNLLKKIKTALCRHDYKHLKRLSDDADKIECKKCKQHYAINWHMRILLKWDDEMAIFYKNKHKGG